MIFAPGWRSAGVLLLCMPATMAMALADVNAADERRSRIERLEASLLAPCCYKEPVSQHQSAISVKMRLEIQNWVSEGKTDEEIVSAYQARYGARVFASHREASWWANGIPWLLIPLSAAGALWLVVRWRARAAKPTPGNDLALPAVPESEEDWVCIEQTAVPPESQARR